LQRLFQKTFMVAKLVRTQTAVSQFPVSIAYSAVELAKQIFTDIKKARVLLIGAGETIELVSTHLKGLGVSDQTFANRTLERAQKLALDLQGDALDLDQMREQLADFDIIFSAVGTSKPILTKQEVNHALKKRKRHPIFMVDLGVPRNIESEVGEHEDIYLYNLDDLRKVVDDNLGLRQNEALMAESIILQQAQMFMRWLDADCAHTVIKDARAQADRIKDIAVRKAHAQLKAGRDPEKVIEYLAHQLTQKLLHSPSMRLKRAGEAQEESLIKAASELLHFE
jgi:glutamyl-tRNA reductase